MLAAADDFPGRGGNAVLGEFFLRLDFVESEAAAFHVFAGVGHAAVFEDLLQLAVLAEGAVHGDEGQIDVVRQNKVGVLHIDFGDFRP